MRFDAAIVGGGVAGLQAALTLARARRSILLIDGGQPRHRFAAHMHNFVGADGLSLSEFYDRAHAELAQYPHAKHVQATLNQASKVGGIFHLVDQHQASYVVRKLLFACGIQDILPDIEGLGELWGRQVLHCSYCHGYEARDKAIAVLVREQDAWSMVESLVHLSARLTFFFIDALPDDAMLARLQANGVAAEFARVRRAERSGDGIQLTLSDGSSRAFDVLFVKPDHVPGSPLPFALGCQDQYGFVQCNEWGQTHVPGVYVAGDMAGGVQQLAAAAASGLHAAMMLNTELAREALR